MSATLKVVRINKLRLVTALSLMTPVFIAQAKKTDANCAKYTQAASERHEVLAQKYDRVSSLGERFDTFEIDNHLNALLNLLILERTKLVGNVVKSQKFLNAERIAMKSARDHLGSAEISFQLAATDLLAQAEAFDSVDELKLTREDLKGRLRSYLMQFQEPKSKKLMPTAQKYLDKLNSLDENPADNYSGASWRLRYEAVQRVLNTYKRD